ncbi:hypothetical protein ABW19_dt0204125 [Dactylella cylindrospora]|nr:hypothetical protein ABW19_dt0204125 [Dactylella cylindrospora]
MEQVLRRTALAKAQAARRYAREAEQRLIRRRQERLQYEASINHHKRFVYQVQKELEEDVKLGPLAPTRGLDAKDRIARDLRTGEALRLPPVVEVRKFFNVAVGDRVVILAGKDRNKVGVVKEVDLNTDSVKVDGMNVYPVRTPDYFAGTEGGDQPGIDQEINIPYTDVRLVHQVPDPQTGVLRDAIVKKIRIADVRKDVYGKKTWKRYIAYTNTLIPWPKVDEKEHEDQPCDTKRMDAEERTYVPTLLKPPFPDTVIDELRGKYSVFRDRHDREFVEKKMREDAEKKAAQKARVVTPLMEINRKIRREKMELGKKQKLTGDLLEQIGQAMASSGSPFLAERRSTSRILASIASQGATGATGAEAPPPS